MRNRLVHLVAAAAIVACAGRRSSSAAEPAAAQALNFIGTRGSDTVTVRYRGIAYTRGDEIEIVLRSGSMPRTGPFTGMFRGFSMALATGDPEPGWPLRVQAASDQVDAKTVHFENDMLADSVVFRIRHVKPDSLAGMWFVLQEWRMWHRDGIPEVAPVAAARSTDVFRPAGPLPEVRSLP